MADSQLYNFPDQSIAESKKDKAWHMDHVRGYISGRPSYASTSKKKEIEQMYRTYLCVVNEEEEKLRKPVTAPHGANLGVEYMVYNLAEQKVEQLIGDYLDRPLKRKSYVMNKEAQNRKLEAKIDMLAEEYFRELNAEFESEHGVPLDTENPQMEIPDDVEEYHSKTYKDIAEEINDDLCEKFLDVDKQKREIVPALRDFLISDECHMSIYEEDGIVKWRKIHPLDFDGDKDPHKVVQDDHEYVVETFYLTKNEILNTYELSEKEKKQLEADFAAIANYQNVSASGAASWVNDRGWYMSESSIFRIAVVQMTWKSRRPLKVKRSMNKKTGEELFKRIPSEKDDVRIREGEELLTTDLEVERHCLMLGHNICLSYGLGPHRNFRQSNKKKHYLNYVSLYRQNPLGVDGLRSVVAKLKKLQDWASEQLFELRLATRRNQGKVLVYDTAQIPKQYLKGGKSAYSSALNRVMHHIKKDQIIFMNSKEKNNRFNFNQFTHVDLATTGLINDIIAGMALIEDLADKMIGLTPGRQGQAGQYSTATNVESQRQASFSRTEVFYRPFDDFLQTCLERMTMLSQKVYKDGDTIHLVLGDLKTKFIAIAPEFLGTDLGWYLSDGGKDAKKKQIVDQAAQLALGNAQTEEMILSLIDVLSADTSVESRAILERAVAASAALKAENAKQEQAQFEEKLKADKEAKESDDNLKREGFKNNIDVAKIYADQKREQEKDKNKLESAKALADFEKEAMGEASKEKTTNTQ